MRIFSLLDNFSGNCMQAHISSVHPRFCIACVSPVVPRFPISLLGQLAVRLMLFISRFTHLWQVNNSRMDHPCQVLQSTWEREPHHGNAPNWTFFTNRGSASPIYLYTVHRKRCRHFIQWVISIVWKCFTGYYSTYSQRCNFRFLHEKGVFSPSTKEAPPKAPLGTMMRL